MMHAIAVALPEEHVLRKAVLEWSANAFERAGLVLVFSGHCEGGRWLASFAVDLLTDLGVN